MNTPRLLLLVTALNGFAAVLLGALGAHALEEQLLARDRVGAWQTASQYHLAHGVAALALVAWAAVGHDASRSARLRRAAWFWQVGCILFAGSIYVLALGGPRALGPVTPLGGLAFLAGWGLLAVEAFRRTSSSAASSSV